MRRQTKKMSSSASVDNVLNELFISIYSEGVWAYFRNKECLQKLDCKCAARGNGPRASRAETEDGRVLKSPQKFH